MKLDAIKKETMKKIIYIFMILQPILDIFTSLSTRHFPEVTSIGRIVRFIFMAFIVVYVLFYSKVSNKKAIWQFLIFAGIFSIAFLLNRYSLIGSAAKGELASIFKFLYLPIVLIGFYDFFKAKIIDIKDIYKMVTIMFIIILVSIVIAYLTNTSFYSYRREESGYIGWFFAANEISAIIVMGSFITLITMGSNIKTAIIYVLLFFISLMIGTKLISYGMLLAPLFYIIYNLIYKRNFKKVLIYLLYFIVFFTSVTFVKAPVKDFSETIKKEPPVSNAKMSPFFSKINSMLSGRLTLAYNTSEFYFDSNLPTKFVGLGYVSEDVNYVRDVEMDMFSVIFRYGFIGFIIYLSMLLYITYKIIKIFIRKPTEEEFVIIFAFVFGTGFGILVGHVLLSPAVSIYLGLFGAYIINSVENKKLVLKKEKIK